MADIDARELKFRSRVGARHAWHIMLGTIAWTVTSRLAIAASWLPRPVYFRVLSYVLQPLLRWARGSAPAFGPESSKDVESKGAGPAPQRTDPGIPQIAPNEERSAPGTAFPAQSVARALVIDGFTPTPDKDAGSNDVYWFMRILLRLGYEVTFVPAFTTAHAGRYTEDLRSLGIICPVAPALTSVNDFVKSNGATFDVVALYRFAVAKELMDVVREFAPNTKVIFNTVDLHFLREQREAELNGQLHAFVEAKRRETQELDVIRAANASVLLSDFEYDYVGRHAPDARRFFIPLAVPVPGRLAPYEGRAGVLFVGGFAHRPNVDAVHFLCGAIWPRVRRLLPDARLFVVGSDPPGEIVAYHAPSEGVEILGYVKDLTELHRTVRIAVAPLRFGAGLKGKVVGTPPVGLPSFFPPVAGEGMPQGGTYAVATADDPDAFARAIADIHENPDQWYRMSDAGLSARVPFSPQKTTRKNAAGSSQLSVPPTNRE